MKIVKDSPKNPLDLNGTNKIETTELKEMSKRMFGSLVKAVVDTEKEIMAVDAELHIDLEQLLIEKENCDPKNLWGINIYPEVEGIDKIEFDSMTNLKPGLGNRSRGVESEEIRKKILEITNKLIK